MSGCEAGEGPRIFVDGGGALRIGGKALLAVIGALKFQMDDWRRRAAETGDEDEEGELLNDIMHLETVLAAFEEELARRGPGRSGS